MILDRVRRHLRRQARRLDAIDAALPQAEDRLDRYRRDAALLMRDAGFVPDPWQAEFLRSTDRMHLVLCARQIGKSLTVSIKALHTAFTCPASTTIIIAPIQPQASELLRKVTTAYYRCGQPIGILRDGATYIEFANRARVIALPGKERSVHSYTADLLLIDEAARVPDAVFNAASPQLSASKGRFVALSTAYVKTGYFYREWGEGTDYRRWSITAKECPRHTPEFLEAERKKMGEWWWAASYMNVFGDDVAAVFREEDIQAALDPTVRCLFDRPLGIDEPITTGTLDPTVRKVFG